VLLTTIDVTEAAGDTFEHALGISHIVEPEVLKIAKEKLNVPICAIGGINEENITLLSRYNIEMYSLISAVYKDDAIEENLKKLHAKI
jgi:thiamine-phosphate pyrophosphorylase